MKGFTSTKGLWPGRLRTHRLHGTQASAHKALPPTPGQQAREEPPDATLGTPASRSPLQGAPPHTKAPGALEPPAGRGGGRPREGRAARCGSRFPRPGGRSSGTHLI